MPQKRGRNAFVRTSVPMLERALSILIVCLLAGIGIAIWIKGAHFDPGLYSLRIEALNSTKAEVTGKDGTAQPGAAAPGKTQPAPKPAESENPETSTALSAKPAVKSEMLDLGLQGVEPMGTTEFYSAENLFEKIDGRAPAYIGFNFQQLRCRSFAVAGAAGSYVDVYEYRMDTPINAFGIFALERDPNGKPVDFATDGYSGEMGYFFRQGSCYVQIIASDQNPKTMELARTIAENRAKALPADDTGLDGRRRLPATDLIPGSITFLQENAQGQAFLKNVFQAMYQFEGKKLPFFLMVTTPESAADALKSYLAFCERFGATTKLPDVKGARLFQTQNFGTWKVIYQREGEMGGVYDAEDGERARRFVEKYLQGQL